MRKQCHVGSYLGQLWPGTLVNLTSGQTLEDLAFHLMPTGNVSGQVRNFTGDPVTGFQVLLLRPAYDRTGRRTFQTVSAARTDDQGRYRFYWITPGRYYLSAGLGTGPNGGPGPRNPNEVPAEPYPTTYYPGTPHYAAFSSGSACRAAASGWYSIAAIFTRLLPPGASNWTV